MRGRWILVLVACAVFPAVTALARTAVPADAPPAPRFQLPTDNGKVDSDSLRGKVVLVDFWASWCGPCAKSFPWMRAMSEKYGGKGFRIVAVNLDKEHQAAEAFLQKHAAPFTVAFDPAGKTAEAFQVPAMPTSFLLDPQGRIIYSHVGFDPGKTKELESLIAEECR